MSSTRAFPFHVVFFESGFVIFPFSMIAAPAVEPSVSSYATWPRGYGGQVVESHSLRSLRTNEAWPTELAAFKIAAGERNRESVGMRAARDLAAFDQPANRLFLYVSRSSSGRDRTGRRARFRFW